MKRNEMNRCKPQATRHTGNHVGKIGKIEKCKSFEGKNK